MRTAVFDTIYSLRPFFFSLREIKETISLDIKIPTSWRHELNDGKAPKMAVSIKIQDENDKHKLISLMSSATKDGYDAVFSVAKEIIKYNQEIEEKTRLFNEKVEELKKYFLEAPIDKLKDISFIKDNVRNKKSTRKVGLGDQEGPGTDGSS